jgi:hypothetical protein
MPFYLCDLAGSGGEDDPCRPVIADHVGAWRGFDCRVDDARPGGTMIVKCDDVVSGVPGVVAVSEAAALALIAAVREARA